MSTETSIGFRKIYYSPKLQAYWIRRLIAFVIDSIIISIASLIVIALVMLIHSAYANEPFFMPWWSMHGVVSPFFTGIILVVYSALTEYVYGYTLGKRIMCLKIITTEGKKPTLDLTFLRNATKIYWIFILLDVVISLALPRDPTQKYTDTFAGTKIIW